MSILKKGLKGAPVKRLQEKLGVKADGELFERLVKRAANEPRPQQRKAGRTSR